MKHINVCYHYIRQVIDDGTVYLTYTPTQEQVVDILTKGLPPALHIKFTGEMGVLQLAGGGVLEQQHHCDLSYNFFLLLCPVL